MQSGVFKIEFYLLNASWLYYLYTDTTTFLRWRNFRQADGLNRVQGTNESDSF